jgi:hypothetical protein
MADRLNDPASGLHIHRRNSPDDDDDRLADEKTLAQHHVDERDGLSELTEMRDLVEGFPDKDKRRLLLKMDLHIIPILISLYCMSCMMPSGLSESMELTLYYSDVIHR